jgi:hypothetical protein
MDLGNVKTGGLDAARQPAGYGGSYYVAWLLCVVEVNDRKFCEFCCE